MANLETINAPNRTFDVEGAVSAIVEVKSSAGTLSAKRGHLLVNVAGVWTAYSVTTDPIATATGYLAVGVLLEDASLNNITATECRVLYAGSVWEQFIRDAGIAKTVVSMETLRTAAGHIVFKDEQ